MSTKKRAPVVNLQDLPVILIIPDMASLFRVSTRTVRRQLEAGTFRPLPNEKYPYRWYRDDVARFLAKAPSRQLRRSPHGRPRQQADADVDTLATK